MRRVLVKVSGEVLAGDEAMGIDPVALDRVADDIARSHRSGVQIAVVVGGGNLFRGQRLAHSGMDRTVGDHMGMLATVMNGLALREALSRRDTPARVLSAIPLEVVCEFYSRDRSLHHLNQGRVVICVGGLGIPYFTTDSAAAERAAELKCDAILKATDVDGVYDKDPNLFSDACMFHELTHDEAIARNLRIMDTSAFALARDNGIPIYIFSIREPFAITRVLAGEGPFTRVVPAIDQSVGVSNG